ncbi:hypothetical protein QAD02_007206 [Eretmocerus hayati]|uniref:Uncharacterized protein n=1 Tax=Eretmocerus hayati TaxID=131215 RepID=A0ACC2N2Z1_9HYME|nr:hypothetical protein QAD02_007206 [Eretmocerus hayati]
MRLITNLFHHFRDTTPGSDIEELLGELESAPKRGKPRHKAWGGYIRQAADGKVTATCRFCSRVYVKINAVTLQNHTAALQEVSNIQVGVNSKKKRCSAEIDGSNVLKIHYAHGLLVKLLLRYRIPFENIDSVHLKNFVRGFFEHASQNVPSSIALEDTWTVSLLADTVSKKKAKKALSNNKGFSLGCIIDNLLDDQTRVSDYLGEKNNFHIEFKSCDLSDPVKSWKMASALPNHKQLSKVASSLVQIPAMQKSIQIATIIQVYNDGVPDSADKRVLLLEIFSEEK